MGRFFFPNGNIYYKLIFKLFFSSRSGILRIISIMPNYAIRPDYDRGLVVINRQQTSYTCPSDGWIMYQSGGASQTGSSFYINNNFISRSSSNFWCGSCFVPVKFNDVVKLAENNYGQLSFFPYKN